MKHFIASLLMLLSFAVSANQAKAELFTAHDQPQVWCLALNIYYEARGSNLADQAAVADVVLNRTQDRRYPSTICEVVKQGEKDSKGNMIRNRCQFSWYCDGKNDLPTNKEAWVKAQQTAYMMVYLEQFRGITEGATHYHANYVKPKWATNLQLIGRIGDHIFYRWK
jgi:spore germination cell wall hydrolase CwlJ-like protein